MRLLLTVAMFLLLGSGGFAQENWPQWRGPGGNGVAAAGRYPIEFSRTKNVVWKIELPGKGSSTPAVWGDSIFVTCEVDGEDGLMCLGYDGVEKWRKLFGKETPGRHRNGSGSNPSPVATEEYIVVYFKSGTVACLKHDGQVQWKKNLVDEHGKDTLYWDRGTSPVVVDGKVVIAVIQGGDSYVVAYDLASGELAWKQTRDYPVNSESNDAYTTPVVVKHDGRSAVVVWGSDYLDAYSAESGERLWQCGGFNPKNIGNWRVIASAVADKEVAIVPYGRAKHLAAIRLKDAAGDVSDSHRLWEKSDLGADIPTPVLHGSQVIVLSDEGAVTCLDKMTGEINWEAKLPRGRGEYFASPVLAGGMLYCAREDGTLTVAKVGEAALEVLAENKMGEAVIATPVPVRGQLLVRGKKHLFLIDEE